ncbi:MAG: ORF6N domain-containing protein, partial [Pirellulaceae bacterium]|nr:ORF6N domain-containing protein [Pirellulaceae bacterium]
SVRGQRVMLDHDLATLYGVSTKALNQSVKRQRDRFPEDFAFQLTSHELADLRSQTVTAKLAAAKRRFRPWVFTEHGVAMLSSVLGSAQAVQVNIAIMRAFVRMRRISFTPGELVSQLIELTRTVQFHDGQIRQFAEILKQMMEPPPGPPKPKIGFRPPESRRSNFPNKQA